MWHYYEEKYVILIEHSSYFKLSKVRKDNASIISTSNPLSQASSNILKTFHEIKSIPFHI